MRFLRYIKEVHGPGEKEGKWSDLHWGSRGAAIWIYTLKGELWWYNPKKNELYRDNKPTGIKLGGIEGEEYWSRGLATHGLFLKNIPREASITDAIRGRSLPGARNPHQSWYDGDMYKGDPLKLRRYDNFWNKAMKSAERYIKK